MIFLYLFRYLLYFIIIFNNKLNNKFAIFFIFNKFKFVDEIIISILLNEKYDIFESFFQNFVLNAKLV